jgi:peptide/nickel transport system substrate-binding protein
MKHIRYSLACTLVASTLIAGCNDATPPASATPKAAVELGKPVAGGEVSWGIITEPVCFDPHRSAQQNAFILIRNYVDSLVGKKADGSFAPWLAKSWTISADGLEYDFVLRDDVTFTDGAPFDAEAVKTNLDYVSNPKNTAIAATFLEYYDHSQVVSPHEVKIVLSRPDSATLESLSSVKLGFLSPKTLTNGADLCSGGPGQVAARAIPGFSLAAGPWRSGYFLHHASARIGGACVAALAHDPTGLERRCVGDPVVDRDLPMHCWTQPETAQSRVAV